MNPRPLGYEYRVALFNLVRPCVILIIMPRRQHTSAFCASRRCVLSRSSSEPAVQPPPPDPELAARQPNCPKGHSFPGGVPDEA